MASEIWVNIGSGNGLLPDGALVFYEELYIVDGSSQFREIIWNANIFFYV